VLGAGPWQLPTVQLAKAMGYRVLVSDCFPDRPAFKVADHYAVVDIVDRNATLALARERSVDGVICDTTDVGVPTAAFVAERLQLPGLPLDAALNCCDKARMRAKCAAAGISGPRYHLARSLDECNTAASVVGLPAVVKPVDNQSGRGVAFVDTPEALRVAFNAALALSRAGMVLIEQYIGGQEFILDSFTIEGRTVILGIARKVQYAENPTVSSRIDYPAKWQPKSKARLIDVHIQTLQELGLKNGIAHAEYIVSGEQVIPLDVAARGGGVHIYTHVLPYISGVNVNREMIALAMGDRVSVNPRGVSRAACVRFFRMPLGKLVDIQGVDAARASPGVAAVHLNVQIGDTIGALSDKDDRPGYVVALAETLSEAQMCAQEAVGCMRVRVGESDRHVAVM